MFIFYIILGSVLIFIFTCYHVCNSNDNHSEQQTYSNTNSYNYTSVPHSTANNAPKQIYHRESYSVIQNDSPFCDNLNYKRYEYKALFTETNRMRSGKIEAFCEDDAITQLKEEGFTEPINLTQIPFDSPTDAQLEACKAHNTTIPRKACKIDVSYIIDKEMEHDSVPNPELISYATEMKIHLSHYIGKKALYNHIFNQLNVKDKIAFFVFCIYRFNSNDRCGNLNKSYYKTEFYQFADSHMNESSFIKSMNRYSGEQLRYFGKLQVENTILEGGSKNTIAYKEVLEFLKLKNLVL